MSIVRSRVDLGGNDVRSQLPGEVSAVQFQQSALTTVGDGTLTAQLIITGLLRRTGPVGAYADTFPTADTLLAACPNLVVGDSFPFIFQNTVAFANTVAAGEGCVLGNNVNIAASLVREYLLTILGDGARQSFSASTTNASAAVTAPATVMAGLRVGQGVTGTGIPASSYILSINLATNSFTLNANATATGTPALTTFPRYRVEGIRSSTA